MKELYNINPSLPKYSFTWFQIFKWDTKQSKTKIFWKTSNIISNFMWSKSHGNTSSYVLRDVASIRIGDLLKTSKILLKYFILAKTNFQAIMIRRFSQCDL